MCTDTRVCVCWMKMNVELGGGHGEVGSRLKADSHCTLNVT